MSWRGLGRWTLIIGSGWSILLAIFLLLLYTLVATQTGSNWVMTRLAQLNPGIHWQQQEGTLLEGIDLTGLRAETPGLTLTAEFVSGRWQLLSLLGGQFQVTQLNAKNIEVELTQTSSDQNPNLWPDFRLPLRVNLGALRLEKLQLTHQERIERLDELFLSGAFGPTSYQIHRLRLKRPDAQIDATGTLAASAPYAMKLEGQWQSSLPASFPQAGSLRLHGELRQIEVQAKLTQPFEAQLSGQIRSNYKRGLAPSALTLVPADLKLDWTIRDWTPPDREESISSAGRLMLKGLVQDYQLSTQFNLALSSAEALPEAEIKLEGSGNEVGLEITTFSLNGADNQLAAQGLIQWQNTLGWNLRLQSTGFDPALFWPDWPGRIKGELATRGALTEQGLELVAQIGELNGTLRGFPLQASGDLSWKDKKLEAQNLVLRQGENQLLLNAVWDEHIRAQWQLSALDLSQIHPELHGRLSATGKLNGTLDKPDLSAQITGSNLSWQNYRVARLQGAIAPTNTADHYQLELTLKDVQQDQSLPLQLQLEATGTHRAQSIQLQAKQSDWSLVMQGNSSWHQDQGKLELQQADFKTDLFGAWQLASSGPTQWHQKSLSLPQHCWQQSSSQICLNGSLSPSRLDLNLELAGLELARLNSLLGDEGQLQGTLAGSAKLNGSMAQPELKIALSGIEAQLLLPQENKLPQSILLQQLQFDGHYQAGQLQIALKTHLLETGNLEAHLSLPWPSDNGALQGRVMADFSQLNWLDPLVPFLSDLGGSAQMELDISGNLDAPKVQGFVQLNQLTAFVPHLGVLVRKGVLNLTLHPDAPWQVIGELESGSGALQLAGTLDFKQWDDWRGDLSLVGESLQTLGLENVKATISPELQIAVAPYQWQINGKIAVPEAQVNLRELPASTIAVSKDQLILDPPSADSAAQQAWRGATDIDLMLGPKVAFSGFGVRGDMKGQLRVRESPESGLRIDGTLDMQNGFYKAYGQKLSVNPGRLIFQGAADNPAIDVKASRKVGDTLVGVQIGGTAQALSSTLFSTPALPPTETMALLITGKPLTNATQADASVLMSAVTSLGISQSAGLTQRLQQSFGLDLLSISSNGDLEQSSVTIGKYLTPRLFVSYVQGLMSANASVNLEYALTDKLTIKAESGAEQSMDILYRVERD